MFTLWLLVTKEPIDCKGSLLLPVEAGSANLAVITLLQAGLRSREAAMAAIESTGAGFVDRAGMFKWLRSKEIQPLSAREDWPTGGSRHQWLQFLEAGKERQPSKVET